MDQELIQATLEDYADAYCAKDLDRLMAVFLDSEEISMIGTGRDELCSGTNEVAGVFARNFREATADRFEWGWKHVAIFGDAATVAITLTIHLTVEGEKLTVPVRWTVALVRTDAGWKWVHRHASAAASSQDEGTAYPKGN